ncbi:Uncharacterised protein [Mycobacteroides abscessus subsp. abscessus]|nr:Uncharacterised protein [Mycobacteroides abscessus subsp. abscessus]SHU02625.1 Uncharacterised protein [Mycobacteroides abscessus subsp. abscessus]SIA25572.1 Uncharacterised protein [Mycobacteroides abscessus subsp. abscessus]SIG40327.1 Uncharacterised protein [Mycobacteroides abscessus subsp. abscessus]SIL32205.1 Uncharacterised protein [Mycobacteroides abscessus subsp. abscessus]
MGDLRDVLTLARCPGNRFPGRDPLARADHEQSRGGERRRRKNAVTGQARCASMLTDRLFGVLSIATAFRSGRPGEMCVGADEAGNGGDVSSWMGVET